MPRGRSRKAREEARARRFSLVRLWIVIVAAATVVVLGGIELVSSGWLASLFSRDDGPADMSQAVVELDRVVDGALVKLGVSGTTVEFDERTTDKYSWTHRTKRGLIPYGMSAYECNLAITREVLESGARVIRGGEEGPDWRGLKTLILRLGYGDITTHTLVLRESGRGEAPEERLVGEGESPKIAIVIDDFGYNSSDVATGIIDLDYPITISILPHTPQSASMAAAARRAGKEILVHIPMEPRGYPDADPGEGALMKDDTREQLLRGVDSALDDVPYAVGANNHMGSAFTSQHIPMRVVMGRLRERGLYFLDSMTSPESVGVSEARRAGVPVARNRLFIDSPLDESGRIDVDSQMSELVEIARKSGSAIGIGHPHPETLRALTRKLPELERQGIELVFVSQLVN
jgi:polysaccharide deacetylase 2 family uncharacterized protein YibQ